MQTVRSTDLRHASNEVKQPVKFLLDKVGDVCKLSIEGKLSREQIGSLLGIIYN
jgi:hypothetical protein